MQLAVRNREKDYRYGVVGTALLRAETKPNGGPSVIANAASDLRDDGEQRCRGLTPAGNAARSTPANPPRKGSNRSSTRSRRRAKLVRPTSTASVTRAGYWPGPATTMAGSRAATWSGRLCLLADIQGGRIDIIVVYKVDRLTRSLADFARLVEIFDAQGASFVSVTQQFNTTSSMGRLTLNVLLSFAQFEREVTGERIRDKIAASKKKGMWMGGNVPLGYDADERALVINPAEAETVRRIFALYRELRCVRRVKEEADRLGLRTKSRTAANGTKRGGKPFSRGHLYTLLSNPIYIGEIAHKGQLYPGQHPALINADTWAAVRDQLAANARDHRRKAHATEPSLLAGLLTDAQGERLTPSHAVKKGRRYRYSAPTALIPGA